MRRITETQRKYLTSVGFFIEKNGYSPTIREVAKEYGVAVKGAYDNLSALKKKGYLSWVPNKARTMKVLRIVP